MAEDEDDYLSDKFLLDAAPAPSMPQTYAEKRKAALKRSQLKSERNKTKSRLEREREAREEGLSKTLFERAAEEGTGNKALAMMMKMGFQPGQALGRNDDGPAPSSSSLQPAVTDTVETDDVGASPSPAPGREDSGTPEPSRTKAKGHLVEPLPLNEWMGKKGIGLGKRAASPSSLDRLAKVAKTEETTDHDAFRDRAREEFALRRAEGRLGPAQRTCMTLDEKAGKAFNVLWLNPNHPDGFPEGLWDLLAEAHGARPTLSGRTTGREPSLEEHLRRQIRADALQPLAAHLDDVGERGGEEDGKETAHLMKEAPFSPEVVLEATEFLSVDATIRLDRVLAYLRNRYHYCFWCGTQYDDEKDLEGNCPGPEEDMHD
ncbi:hypothetical protein OF83DRAFT_1062240 [Amylostereum chailletii]|nr:hypothetical protein OF83DRAFT_1062240 [Amylostereum chailletii]